MAPPCICKRWSDILRVVEVVKITINTGLKSVYLEVFSSFKKPTKKYMFFAAPSRPTNRTTSYKVYIASCSVKRKRNGFLLLFPSLFQGEPSNRLMGLWIQRFLNCCHLLLKL